MPDGQQLPSLWDPQDLFLHLFIWAGVPAVVIAVVTVLLGIFNSIKGWIQFGRSAAHGATIARGTLASWTTHRQQAIMRLLLLSLVAVVVSYMLAVILDAGIRLIAADPHDMFSVQAIEDHVLVTPWPLAALWTVVGEIVGIGVLGLAYIADLRGPRVLVKALGGVVVAAAGVVLLWLGFSAICMWLGLLLEAASTAARTGSDPVPLPLAIMSTVTAALAGIVVLVLPEIPSASEKAFGAARP